MVIGNGDIAKVLKDRKGDKKLYFVSGVSNSSETDKMEFAREVNLLLEQDKKKHIVYCSSLCVFYSKTPYANHKRLMEECIKENFLRYTILRLGNIDFGKNPHTIINSLRNSIDNGEPIEIQDTYRYIVSKQEFLHWVDMIPEWQCEMNIIGKRMHVKEIVRKILYE